MRVKVFLDAESPDELSNLIDYLANPRPPARVERPAPTPPPGPENGKLCYTADDVAKMLGVARRWVYHRIKSGEIPALRIGSHLRIQASDFEEWRKSRIVRKPVPLANDEERLWK